MALGSTCKGSIPRSRKKKTNNDDVVMVVIIAIIDMSVAAMTMVLTTRTAALLWQVSFYLDALLRKRTLFLSGSRLQDQWQTSKHRRMLLQLIDSA